MKSFRRKLMSGFFLFAFILLLEILLIVFFHFFMDNVLEYLWPTLKTSDALNAREVVTLLWAVIRLIEIVAAIILFFKTINIKEDPEFKIPWIAAIFIVPILALTLFLMFGKRTISPQEKRVIDVSKASYTPFFIKEMKRENREEFVHELGRSEGVFKYIKNTSGLDVHRHNRVTYYKNGEAFFPALIEGLKTAEKFIFMEFFIITDGKEWSAVQDVLIEKSRQGVEVRIVYDDLGCSGTISPKTPKKLAKYGIKCIKFHPLRPVPKSSYNNRDHRKIVVIDHKMAFTGGINLADEYANEIVRFGYWKDTMIKIEGSAINNLITTFLQNYDLSTEKPSQYEFYLNHKYPMYEDEGYIAPFGDGPGGIDDALIGEQNYINILNYAQKRVDISTPYLIPTYKLMDAIRNAALRGVEVNLIVPGIPDKKLVYKIAKSNFRFLLDAGVNIYIYTPGFNHMKSALADSELAFVGTINFDFRSLVHHFECGATLYKCPCLKDIQDDFNEMMSVSEKVDKNFKLGVFSRFVCGLLKLFFPLL